jgi:hypothetical protein
MDHGQAMLMLAACFTKESEGLHAAEETHRLAADSYCAFVEGVAHLNPQNREMRLMRANSIEHYLRHNCRALARFRPPTLR